MRNSCSSPSNSPAIPTTPPPSPPARPPPPLPPHLPSPFALGRETVFLPPRISPGSGRGLVRAKFLSSHFQQENTEMLFCLPVLWDPLIRSSLTVNPLYKKAKNLVLSKVFFMTCESSDIRISLIRNPPYKNVNFWSHRGR